MTEIVSCAACEGVDHEHWGRLDGVNILRCRVCGLVCQHPYPTSEQLNELYSSVYHETRAYDGKSSPDGILRSSMYEHDAEHLERVVGTSGRILDVGCAEGVFLTHLSGDWELHGVEISPLAARRAQERGVNTFCGSFEDYDPNLRDYFDVVLFRGVFEHILDPAIALRKSRHLLREGGWLVISNTPNMEGLGARLFRGRYRWIILHEHVNLYSPRSMIELMHRHQFRVDQIVLPWGRTPREVGLLTPKDVQSLIAEIRHFGITDNLVLGTVRDLRAGDVFRILRNLVSGRPSPPLPGDVFTLYARKGGV